MLRMGGLGVGGVLHVLGGCRVAVGRSESDNTLSSQVRGGKWGEREGRRGGEGRGGGGGGGGGVNKKKKNKK
jgi:hypothetical protein